MATALREVTDTIFMVHFRVNEEILADDDDTSWADIARHLKQRVRCTVHGKDVLSYDMVETKIHFVKSECFLEISRIDCAKVLIQIAIVNL